MYAEEMREMTCPNKLATVRPDSRSIISHLCHSNCVGWRFVEKNLLIMSTQRHDGPAYHIIEYRLDYLDRVLWHSLQAVVFALAGHPEANLEAKCPTEVV